MYLISTEEANQLVQKWETGQMEKAEWTHEMHLIMGMAMIVRFGPKALYAMQERIIRHNEATGTANTDSSGYHATLTLYWLWNIRQFMLKNHISTFDEDTIDALVFEEELANRNSWQTFYPLEIIKSTNARRHPQLPVLAKMEGIDYFIKKTAIDIFDEHAAHYQQKYMDVRLYGSVLDAFCAAIATPNAEVLDIACGPGNATRYILEKRPDFAVLGIDLAPAMLELAKANNPTAAFKCFDARHIADLPMKFHGILCAFGLPYWNRAEATELIRQSSAQLHPGGVLYLSAIDGDYEKSGIQTGSTGDQVYQYFHPAESIEDVLKNNGFSILETQRVRYPDAAGGQVTDWMILAEKEK